MTTYKEKYHLKKTQPIKNRHKANQINLLKQHLQAEKVNIIKRVPVQRKPHKDINPNYQQHNLKDNLKEKNLKSEIDQKRTQQKSQEQKYIQIIHQQIQSASIVQKFNPSPNYGVLTFPKKGPIDTLQKINILHSVQNFFIRIIKPDNGCICEQPCQWASKLFKWIDTPQFLVIDHYQKLKQKIRFRTNRRKVLQLQYFQSLEEEQKDQQIQKSFKQIGKDVERTQSQSQTFQNDVFRNRLENILKCYVIEDPKVGYVQGMNMILSGILYHVKDEARSYGIFRKLLYSIRSIYLDSFKQSFTHVNKIQNLIKTHLFDIYMHFCQLQVELHMICLPWVLSLLTSIVPLDSIHLIYYGFIKQKWNFFYKVCLSIFVYFKEKIISTSDTSEVLVLLSAGQSQFKEIDWDDIVKYSNNIQLTFNN